MTGGKSSFFHFGAKTWRPKTADQQYQEMQRKMMADEEQMKIAEVQDRIKTLEQARRLDAKTQALNEMALTAELKAKGDEMKLRERQIDETKRLELAKLEIAKREGRESLSEADLARIRNERLKAENLAKAARDHAIMQNNRPVPPMNMGPSKVFVPPHPPVPHPLPPPIRPRSSHSMLQSNNGTPPDDFDVAANPYLNRGMASDYGISVAYRPHTPSGNPNLTHTPSRTPNLDSMSREPSLGRQPSQVSPESSILSSTVDLQAFQAQLEVSLGNVHALVESWIPTELQKTETKLPHASLKFEPDSSRLQNSRLGLGCSIKKQNESKVKTNTIQNQLIKNHSKRRLAEIYSEEFPNASRSFDEDEDSRTSTFNQKHNSLPATPLSLQCPVKQAPPTQVLKLSRLLEPKTSNDHHNPSPVNNFNPESPSSEIQRIKSSSCCLNIMVNQSAGLSKRQLKRLRKLERSKSSLNPHQSQG